MVLQTLDETGASVVTRQAYQDMGTLRIPREMAIIKTNLDMRFRDRLRQALDSGTISYELAAELDLGQEADVLRTIAARDALISARRAAGESIDDLATISDSHIREAVHAQWGELFDRGSDGSGRILRDVSDYDLGRAIDDSIPRVPGVSSAPGHMQRSALEASGAVARRLLRNRLLSGLVKGIPVVGTILGLASVAQAATEGNYSRAAVEAVGLFFDPVDWAVTAVDIIDFLAPYAGPALDVFRQYLDAASDAAREQLTGCGNRLRGFG